MTNKTVIVIMDVICILPAVCEPTSPCLIPEPYTYAIYLNHYSHYPIHSVIT